MGAPARRKPTPSDIATNLEDHRKEVCDAIGSIDQELATLLKQKRIITDESDLDSESQQKDVAFVLEKVESRGGEAFFDLLWCLDQTGRANIGHRYATALLRDEYSLDMLSEIITSTVLQQRYQESEVRKKTWKLSLKDLVPHLIANQFITNAEAEKLSEETQLKGVSKLMGMLKRKGPLSHLYLTMALIGAKQANPLHKEILEKVLV